MSYNLLTPITNINHIIVEIILKCEELCEQDEKKSVNEFKTIIPYGTANEPYFVASHIFKFLNPNEMNTFRRIKDYKKGLHYIKSKIPINNRVAVNMLSTLGVMKAMCMSTAPIAIYFQSYIHDLLKSLWNRKQDIMVEELKIVEIKLTNERDRRRQLEKLNYELSFLQEGLKNISDFGDTSQKELTILKRKFLISFNLYLVDWHYINEILQKTIILKNINLDKRNKIKLSSKSDFIFDLESSSDPGSDIGYHDLIEYYDFKHISLHDLQNEYSSDDFYFYITQKDTPQINKKYIKLINHIYLENNSQLTRLKENFINAFKNEQLNNIIQNSYLNIIDIRDCLFIEDNKNYLIKK